MGLTSVVAAMLIATAAPAAVLANAPIWGSFLTEQGGLARRAPPTPRRSASPRCWPSPR